MQEPIRYYITKNGEEPTVRSVKVARHHPEIGETPGRDAAKRVGIDATSGHDEETRRLSVKGLIQGALRKRAFALSL